MTNVNSFFRTKLAQAPKEDPIIDPGEAAAGGMALISSPISKFVVPAAIKNLISKTYAKSDRWGGDPIYGLKRIGDSKIPKDTLEEYARLIKKQTGVAPRLDLIKLVDSFGGKELKPQSILGGLFKIDPKPAFPGKITHEPRNLDTLIKIQKSVNSMLDRYNLPEKGVRLSFRSGPISRMAGPHYNYASKEIVLPKLSKDLALHEIGHAAHWQGTGAKAAHVLRRAIARGSMLATPMAYIAGDEIQKMFPGKIDDKVVDFVQKHAPAIVASTYAAASLYPEAQATIRAISHVNKTEGAAAAKKTARALFPHFVSAAVPVIPAIVGIGLARKWHREAKENQKKLEKMAGLVSGMAQFADDVRVGSGHIMKQIGPQAGKILEQPLGEFMKTMYESGKNVVKSPEFASGAAIAGIPTALIAYAKMNTPHGRLFRERKRELGLGERNVPFGKGSPAAEIAYHEERAGEDSVTPAIVGITAAISGGVIAKLMSDIGRIL